jgi:hypothetical protein
VKPETLTRRLVADFLGLKSPDALNQKMLKTEGRKSWKDKKGKRPIDIRDHLNVTACQNGKKNFTILTVPALS